MGRLDNAMRRAAEEQAAKAAAATLDATDSPTADLPGDAPRAANGTAVPVAPAAPAVPDVLDLRQEGSVPAGPAEPPGLMAPASPFACIDPRLATKTVVDDSMIPSAREQYRRLAAALHQAQRANGFKVVMIVSAVAGEGKTLTAANLALTLSESYRRNVLLVDGDLRRPSLHTVFQVDGAPGLSEGLISPEEPKLPLHRVSPRLTVLPAGRATSDPIGALASDRMRRLIDEAREVFDWVIIDTPPVALLSDASLLSSMADGVVLVIKADSTPYDMVNRAVELIRRDRIMGVVLNRASELPHRSAYDHYKYYGGSNLPAPRE